MSNIIVEKYNLFPTLIYEVQNFLSETECDVIKNFLVDRGCLFTHNALLGSSDISSHRSSVDIIDEIEKNNIVTNLTKKLMFVLEDYAKNFNFFYPLRLANSWFNISNYDSMLMFHSHPNSVLSGAIYINASEESNTLAFKSPNMFYSFFSTNQNTYEIFPKVGKMVLFPSWLEHGSLDKNKMNERVVISFNTTFSYENNTVCNS